MLVEDLGGDDGLLDDLTDVSFDHGELHHGLKNGMLLLPLFTLGGKHAGSCGVGLFGSQRRERREGKGSVGEKELGHKTKGRRKK